MANDAQDPIPTPEEFAAWIGARYVLQHLKELGDHYALTSLLTRLSLGKVRAIAGSAVGGSSNNLSMLSIKAEWWGHAQDIGSVHAHLWKTGEATIRRGSPGGGRPLIIQLFDVRFNRADIDAMIQTPPVIPKATTYSDLFADPRVKELEAEVARQQAQIADMNHMLKRYLGGAPPPQVAENVPKAPENVPRVDLLPVTSAEFDAWFAGQLPDVQLWGGAKLREKCSRDHSGRRVVKKATDGITKGRQTGRKPTKQTSRD